MKTAYFFVLFAVCQNGGIVSASFDIMVVPDHKQVLDVNLFESVLDQELCEEQIRYTQQNNSELLLEFIDAGYRTPRGVLTGNVIDLGNYYQCLGINQPIPNSVVEGKYCMIELPLNQNWPSLPSWPTWPEDWPEIPWPDLPWPELNPNSTRFQESAKLSRDFNSMTADYEAFSGVRSNQNRIADSPLAALTFRLGVCIPKACSTRTALNALFNNSEVSLIEYREAYCRLPNDKHWVAGEIVALSIFGLFGVLVLLSTAYDLRHNVFLQKDPKKPAQVNKLLLAFSAYTNTRRLVTYTPIPGTLECLDGIRSFAMMWVIIGHTFVNQISSQLMANTLDSFRWMTSLQSIWITAAPITVDTFFMISGLLLVYTTAGKLTSMRLLKQLHLFYLNRLLRMFPLLAAMILLQISVLSRVADGPYWDVEIEHTHRCRVYWWTTLLHVQNLVNPAHMCLGHTWYLAIDVQMHILSPIVLVWVLTGKRRVAWTALVAAMIAILTASTTYNFIRRFPSGPIIPSRPDDAADYLYNYYVHTLPRASPFFVGLIFGYILHLNRGKKAVIPFFAAALIWICTITIAALTIYSSYPIMQLDWDNQFADSMINSFMRPAWAVFVGWLIFACEHGYAGPVNWLLCLRTWKVLGRLSYAMYIVHYPLIFVIFAMPVVPIYFNVQYSLFHFLADFSLAAIVSFILTILIDAPCSVIIKHFMGPGPKRPLPKVEDKEPIEEKEKPKENVA